MFTWWGVESGGKSPMADCHPAQNITKLDQLNFRLFFMLYCHIALYRKIYRCNNYESV